MKKFLRILVFAIIVISVISLFSINASAESGNALRYGRSTLQNRAKSEAYLYVYDKLVSECSALEQHRFELAGGSKEITIDELKDVFNTFLNDYPEYFWLTGGYKYSYDEHTSVVSALEPVYKFSKNQIIAMEQALTAKVNTLTSGLSHLNQYEKSLVLHDRLAAAVEYVQTDNDQHAYGALVEGKAVCAGYARAYQLLLHKVGIPGWYVRGSSKNVSTGETVNHGWNLVSIDGKWYYTDVTWDDQGDTLYHAYLNLPFNIMEEDHKAVDFRQYLPTQSYTDANYFYKNGLVMNGFNTNTLANLLKKNNLKTSVFVTGDVKTFINSINNTYIPQILAAAGVSYSSYRYNYKYIGREVMLNITVEGGNVPQHIHSLSPVSANQSTCTFEGNRAYYVCRSCGKNYTDAGGTNEITDSRSLMLPLENHVPKSTYNNDTVEHWQTCKNCNKIIVTSVKPHTDSNSDYRCDVCSYNYPRQTESTTKAPPTTTHPLFNNDTPNNDDPIITPDGPEKPIVAPSDSTDKGSTNTPSSSNKNDKNDKDKNGYDDDYDYDNEYDDTESTNEAATGFIIFAIIFGSFGIVCIVIGIFVKKKK